MIKRTFTGVFAFLVFCFAGTQAQWVQPFPEGLGIEVGGGHNQLMWHVNAYPPFRAESDYPRQEFSFTPTFRLSYELHPFESGQILPFVGYDKFGGRSPEDPTGYKDEYWITAIDIGLIGTYRLGNFKLGPGVKYNRHLKKIVRAYGPTGPNSQFNWVEMDDDIFLKNFSYDIGIRTSWEFSHWMLSGEAWFGISRLEKNDMDSWINIRENHFRILAGYRL